MLWEKKVVAQEVEDTRNLDLNCQDYLQNTQGRESKQMIKRMKVYSYKLHQQGTD